MLAKALLCVAWTGTVVACWVADGFAADAVLPEGSAPAPIVSRYFPDRLHEFVWRNWNAVEPARLAKLLGASVQDVVAMAESMGLPPAAEIPKEMKTRGYITLIRRNWHLLPYEQLLELVEMTPEQLAVRAARRRFSLDQTGILEAKVRPASLHRAGRGGPASSGRDQTHGRGRVRRGNAPPRRAAISFCATAWHARR